MVSGWGMDFFGIWSLGLYSVLITGYTYKLHVDSNCYFIWGTRLNARTTLAFLFTLNFHKRQPAPLWSALSHRVTSYHHFRTVDLESAGSWPSCCEVAVFITPPPPSFPSGGIYIWKHAPETFLIVLLIKSSLPFQVHFSFSSDLPFGFSIRLSLMTQDTSPPCSLDH